MASRAVLRCGLHLCTLLLLSTIGATAQNPTTTPQQPAAGSGTSTDFFVMPGSDFDRPYANQTDADGLVNYGAQGGFVPAISNLYKAGAPLVNDIVDNWK